MEADFILYLFITFPSFLVFPYFCAVSRLDTVFIHHLAKFLSIPVFLCFFYPLTERQSTASHCLKLPWPTSLYQVMSPSFSQGTFKSALLLFLILSNFPHAIRLFCRIMAQEKPFSESSAGAGNDPMSLHNVKQESSLTGSSFPSDSAKTLVEAPDDTPCDVGGL